MLNQIEPTMIIDGKLIHQQQTVEFIEPPIYEVIRVKEGIPLFYEEHLERLFASLDLMNMATNLDEKLFLSALQQLIHETQVVNNNIRLEIGKVSNETVSWVLFWVQSVYPEKSVYARGVPVVTFQSSRPNPHAKVFRKSFVDEVNQLKATTGAFEVLLIREDDVITEGSRSNLFFIKEGAIYSPKESDVLKGVSRKKLLEILLQGPFSYFERDITSDEINSFDACFLTGTSIHLLPIHQIDNHIFQSETNEILKALIQLFDSKIEDYIQITRRQLSC